MPKKKKAQNPQPVVRHSSSEPENDSDSSDVSNDSTFVSRYAGVRKEKGAAPKSKQKTQPKHDPVRVRPSEPDPVDDILIQAGGFKKVGSGIQKSQSYGMGLDEFSPIGNSRSGAKTKSQNQLNAARPKLPPVYIFWPLDEYQFRLACNVCFEKTGEGYRGYNLNARLKHTCEKDVLIIRRKDNQSLNWIKVRHFPFMPARCTFSEFKLCQNFAGSFPCKIGEANCTFAHNWNEKHLWDMERDGNFSVKKFKEDLRKNGIDTSEELEKRQVPVKNEPQRIPGLNFTQRLASPAPLATPAPRASSNPPAQRKPAPGVPPVANTRVPPPVSVPRVPPPASVPRVPPPNVPLLPHPAASMPNAARIPPLLKTVFPDGAPPLLPNFSRPGPPPTQNQPPISQLSAADNTLKDFDYKIFCPQCFRYDNFPGRYNYKPFTHICEENYLAVRPRGATHSPWMRVRDRTNHRDFHGKYVLCNSVKSKCADLCRYGEGGCSFAHNEAEQVIWAMEKNGRFSVTDFILANRNMAAKHGFTVEELLKKHPGTFIFVCRVCYYGNRISKEGGNSCCSGPQRHKWNTSSVLAHVNKQGQLTIVDHRKFKSKEAFFRICKFYQYCQDQVLDKCLSAHSILERDVWMVERDSDVSREEIVRVSQQAPNAAKQQTQNREGSRPATRPQPTQPTPGSRSSSGVRMAPPLDIGGGQPSREKVPFAVQAYCGMCWSQGTRTLESGSSDKCAKGHSSFQLKRVFLIERIWRELRKLPHMIPRNFNFTVCNFIQQKKKCQYQGQGPCQFAHSEEERVLWIWMARHKVQKVEDVVKAHREDVKSSTIQRGDSVVTATTVKPSPPPAQVRMPTDLQGCTNYCRYCSVQTNSERQWQEHCASEKHSFNVNSDRDHQWNFRQPPWGQGGNLDICSKHMDGGRCPYSGAPDMFNLCKWAHSTEELDEWRERYEWRRMKRTLAREQNMFSYMDTLLEKYNTADARVNVMSESVAGVKVTCTQPLEVFRQEKNAVVNWVFVIQTQLQLERVALVHHSARLHFSLQSGAGSRHQIADGDQFEDVDDSGRPCYKVTVTFSGGMFGSFAQWAVFDFGTKPVLLRKLNVELGHESVHEKVKDLRQKLSFDRWTGENREVILYSYSGLNGSQKRLLQTYKEPTTEAAVTQSSIRELNQHNYVHKMHHMLHLEEITRHKLISSFNVVSQVEVMDKVHTGFHGTFQSREGELFLRLPLSENLTEDTGAGKLILTSVKSALLTRCDHNIPGRVYEAIIETKGKDHVYLTCSPVCVKELKMRSGMSVKVEVQFQLNRRHFVHMHHALDLLPNTDIVFPDITKINPLLNEQTTLKVSSRQLNQDQLQAIRHIVAERTGYTPPFIMFGPFGTGKTETLAQAAMIVLREMPEAKVLICAQSNSSADLYITKHLDPFLRKSKLGQGLLLRVVSTERRVPSIPEAARKYCCFSPDGTTFELPSAASVKQHRLVITTVEMSLCLADMMCLRGHFTHIFIDEAAQVLECETIMPLTLATDKTCVVLTGDHLQISPKVYCAEARRQNFGMSMLERLYLYYFRFFRQLQRRSLPNPLNIFLSVNYRTKREILRFISAVFYGGPEKLTAGGSIPSVVELTPLSFYAVPGREVQEEDSVSLYNAAETDELVERIEELLNKWPEEWGKPAPEEIGVVTPYHDQVKHIRFLLKRHQLASVNVETVQNIQGKEFRALFISTVRTQHLLDSDHIAGALEEAETMGDVTDFAFLSDPKLLNTALTRAKSLVAVVGDPLALCAIGECTQVWRTYLKHCSNMNSLHPPSLTYDSIKHQVIRLQLSPMGRRLAEVTEMFKNPDLARPSSQSAASKPRQENQHRSASVDRNASSDTGDKASRQEVYVDDISSLGAGDATAQVSKCASEASPSKARQNGISSARPPPLRPMSKAKARKREVKADDSVGTMPIMADEILVQLAKESRSSVVGGRDASETSALTPECVRLVLEEGQAVVTYNSDLKNVDHCQVLQQASEAGLEFAMDELINEEGGDDDDDSVDDDDDDEKEVGSFTEYFNYSLATLKSLLRDEPDRFKHCTLHMTPGVKANSKAKVIDPQDLVQAVEVRGSRRCGRAFHEDEVVVEILPEEERAADGAVQGQVVGIFQRAVDFRCLSFVCSATVGSSGGVMKPVDSRFPSLYNATVQQHVQRVKKGFVCVYDLGQDGTLTFSRYDKVEADKLYLVRYLRWMPQFFHPLGVVVAVMATSTSTSPDCDLALATAIKVMTLERHLPLTFSQQVIEEAAATFHTKQALSDEEVKGRDSMVETWSFTIGSLGSSDSSSPLQVAFSIDQPSDDSYQVCVHVCDVSRALERGGELDQEALQRACTIMGSDAGGGDKSVSIPILPEVVKDALCSLHPEVERCALTVAMTVSGGGEGEEELGVVGSSLHRTVVSSKHHFSPLSVQEVLADSAAAESDYLKSCVLVLHQIASMHRRHRLGNAHLDPDSDLDPWESSAPDAHRLVRELVLMANRQVAEHLLRAFPQCTPLLRQAPPSPADLDTWKSRHAADAFNSVALTRPFLQGTKVCTCSMVCMCVLGYMKERTVVPREHFDVMERHWEKMKAVASQGEGHLLHTLIASAAGHPQTSLAQHSLEAICPEEHFVCSGDLPAELYNHYSLNLACLTDIANPLHSYLSIVVQRLATAVILQQPCPYSQSEISHLAAAFNRAQRRAESYSMADTTAHVAAALMARPVVVHTVVESVDGQRLKLLFPDCPYVPEQERTVSINSLCPAFFVQASLDQLKLTWQARRYDASRQTDDGASTGGGQDAVELCADRFVRHVTPYQWHKLLAALREEDEQKQAEAVRNMQSSPASSGRALDVSLEAGHGALVQHFSHFSLTLRPGTVLQVQLMGQLAKGFLTPRLQVLSLTPSVDLCLEHQADPVRCFVSPASVVPTDASAGHESQSDEVRFLKQWRSALTVESAEAAVRDQSSAVVHNVTILWSRGGEPRRQGRESSASSDSEGKEGSVIVGQISLKQSFCQQRRLFWDQHWEDFCHIVRQERQPPPPYLHDLACVRYSRIPLPEDGATDRVLDERAAAVMQSLGDGSVTWVGHCSVVGVAMVDDEVRVRLELQSSAMTVPALLLDSEVTAQLPCTVEWIPKTPLFRFIDLCMSQLLHASDLAKDIAVGRNPVNNIDQSDVVFLKEKMSEQLNKDQKEAVLAALARPFTVVQGPPGSGKTLTACYLVVLFVERNRMVPQPAGPNVARTQVLVCTACDSAADVVEAYFKKLGKMAPRMVRVYDEETESLTFPVPWDTTPPSKKVNVAGAWSAEHEEISLHHMIRRPSNPFCQRIMEYESLFALYSNEITDDQVEVYRQLVLQAQLFELRQAEVILTTCGATVGTRMALGTNVKQILVDGCESCLEPESLIPVILMRQAQQLVLLGDSKQLLPAVTNRSARSQRLTRSLVDRYSPAAVCLYQQYRMHEAINQFPSDQFYDSKMVVATSTQTEPSTLDLWPGSPSRPIAFYHVTGQEKLLTTVTETGLRQSYCNPTEAQVVVSVVEGLIQKGVAEQGVVVVTPFDAQLKTIQLQLTQRNLAMVMVTSVQDCQGREFDYAVFSTVRSLPRVEVEHCPTDDWLETHLGPMGDRHLVNTAITRPKRGLVITGNKHLLQSHGVWKSLLKHYRQHKAVVDA